MPQIDILIQGRSYSLQCAEGEEKRAHSLAAHISRHAGRLTARLGAMPDAQLLLMVSMMIADELLEAREHIGRLQEEGGEARPLLTSAEEEAELGAARSAGVLAADTSEVDIAESASRSATRTGASRSATRTGASRTGSFLAEEGAADSDASQATAEAVAAEAAADVGQDDPTELGAGIEEEEEDIVEAVDVEEAEDTEEMEEESTAEQAEHDRELAERIEASSRRLERIADLLEAEQAGTLSEALAEEAEGEGESGRLDFSSEAEEAAGEDDAEPEQPPPPRRGFRPD